MHLNFSIKSDTKYLVFLRRLFSILSRLDSELDIDHRAQVATTLAMIEAVDNVIFHAHKSCATELIDIDIRMSRGRIEICVFDNGDGFDVPESDVPPVDSTHGRGLFIINSVMHEVNYVRGRPNILKMVYYLEAR